MDTLGIVLDTAVRRSVVELPLHCRSWGFDTTTSAAQSDELRRLRTTGISRTTGLIVLPIVRYSTVPQCGPGLGSTASGIQPKRS